MNVIGTRTSIDIKTLLVTRNTFDHIYMFTVIPDAGGRRFTRFEEREKNY
jgi:hypothetical protein